MSFMRDKSVVARLFDEISLKYKDRNGGYTRILRADSRPGDSADMALIELIESGEAKEEKKGKTKKATSRKKAEASVKQGKKAA